MTVTLTCGCITSKSLVTSSPPLCDFKDLSLGVGSIRIIQDDFIARSLITSTKTLFQNRITFTVLGIGTWGMFLGLIQLTAVIEPHFDLRSAQHPNSKPLWCWDVPRKRKRKGRLRVTTSGWLLHSVCLWGVEEPCGSCMASHWKAGVRQSHPVVQQLQNIAWAKRRG